MILRTQHNILKFLLEDIEKWVNFEVIVGIPLLIRAIILGI